MDVTPDNPRARGTRPSADAAALAQTNSLTAEVFAELRALAAARLRSERPHHTLRPTEIVHEAYLRLVQQNRTRWQSRTHFLAVASTIIRRVLVDHARTRAAAKRGGASRRLSIDADQIKVGDSVTATEERTGHSTTVDVLDLDQAMLELATLDDRQARIVELRFFGALDVPETAKVLGVSERTVKSDWRVARAWLRDRLAR